MPSPTSEAQPFLELIFADKPDDLLLYLRIVADDESRWFPDVEQAAALANAFTAQDVYVSTGLASRDYGDVASCSPEEISGITGICVDIELCSDAHPKPTLPRTVDEALSILPRELPPTYVVDTGGGVQACWLFEKLYVFENDSDRKQAASLTQRWNTLVRDNGRMRGWSIERVADLARLLRVPGTTNCKDPANPKPVTIHSRPDHRYNPSELIEYLDDMSVPDQDAEIEARREWAQRFQNKPLTINLAARMSDDLLNRWLQKDARFKNTWFRQRSDLNDQSQSGYDLALANFGVSAGLAEQQIVDLIVHHRAMHKQKPRTRLDYFYRTLSTAANHGNGAPGRSAAASSLPESQAADPQQVTSEPRPAAPSTPISDRDKIAMCDRISEELGVEILRIVKLSGREPVYRMELAEGRVHFDNAGKLISQNTVRVAIAARTGKLIPHFKPIAWRQLVQCMLDACVVEEGGADLECEGAARMYLADYLGEIEFIPAIEGQSPQDLRKPMVREGRITVCATDLQMFINKSRLQNLSVIAVAAMLSSIGAKSIRVRGNNIREQSRWELPLNEFDPADYSPRGREC